MFQDVLMGRGLDAILEGVVRFAFADDLRTELAFRGYDLDVLRGAGSGAGRSVGGAPHRHGLRSPS